jgi:hypothetical protein
MIAVGSEEMFDVVVGARKVGDFVADKEVSPVTPGDLEEVVEGRSQVAGLPGGAGHANHEAIESMAQMRRR